MRTSEQILALAPDASAAKAAEGMASPRKWLVLGANDAAVWGECQGSARDPYRTQVDVRGPAFRCSCPSRKIPCKHCLGLLLLHARAPERFDATPPPEWVAEWLARRDAQAQKAAAPPPAPTLEAEEAAASRRAASQARTAAARETKVAGGVEELERWLRDLVRRGLAEAQSQPGSFWNGMAARLVDAQAPGLARRVRELGALTASGAGWQDRALAQIGRLHLLCASYPRLAGLPEPTQADIRTAIGWPQREADLADAEGVRDRWLVLGQRVEEEDNMRTQRTWLWGEQCAQPALALSFAMFGQPLDHSLLPGAAHDAELALGRPAARNCARAVWPASRAGALPRRGLLRRRAGRLRRRAGPPALAGARAAGVFRRHPRAARRALVAARCRWRRLAAGAQFHARLAPAGAERRRAAGRGRRVGWRGAAAAQRVGRRRVLRAVGA